MAFLDNTWITPPDSVKSWPQPGAAGAPSIAPATSSAAATATWTPPSAATAAAAAAAATTTAPPSAAGNSAAPQPGAQQAPAVANPPAAPPMQVQVPVPVPMQMPAPATAFTFHPLGPFTPEPFAPPPEAYQQAANPSVGLFSGVVGVPPTAHTPPQQLGVYPPAPAILPGMQSLSPVDSRLQAPPYYAPAPRVAQTRKHRVVRISLLGLQPAPSATSPPSSLTSPIPSPTSPLQMQVPPVRPIPMMAPPPVAVPSAVASEPLPMAPAPALLPSDTPMRPELDDLVAALLGSQPPAVAPTHEQAPPQQQPQPRPQPQPRTQLQPQQQTQYQPAFAPEYQQMTLAEREKQLPPQPQAQAQSQSAVTALTLQEKIETQPPQPPLQQQQQKHEQWQQQHSVHTKQQLQQTEKLLKEQRQKEAEKEQEKQLADTMSEVESRTSPVAAGGNISFKVTKHPPFYNGPEMPPTPNFSSNVSTTPADNACDQQEQTFPTLAESKSKKKGDKKQQEKQQPEEAEQPEEAKTLLDYWPGGNVVKATETHGQPEQTSCTLWVGNLGWNVTEDKIREEFSTFGEITGLNLLPPEKHCAFVTFVNLEDAIEAHRCMQRSVIDGQYILVRFKTKVTTAAAEQQLNPVSKSVWVGHVDTATPEQQQGLCDLCSKYGHIEGTHFVPSKMYAFVNFATESEASACVYGLQGKEHCGKLLKTNFGKPQAQPLQQQPMITLQPQQFTYGGHPVWVLPEPKPQPQPQPQPHSQPQPPKQQQHPQQQQQQPQQPQQQPQSQPQPQKQQKQKQPQAQPKLQEQPKAPTPAAALPQAQITVQQPLKLSPASKSVWISHVDTTTAAQQLDLRKLCERYGRVESTHVVAAKKCFFVDFSSVEEAAACVAALQGMEVMGKNLKLNYSTKGSDLVPSLSMPATLKPTSGATNSVWIGNVDTSSPAQKQALRDLVAKYGHVEGMHWVQPKQCVFVDYATDEEATACMLDLQGREYCGAVLKTNYSRGNSFALQQRLQPLNPVSRSVWISNVDVPTKEQQKELRELVSQYGVVEGTHFIPEKNCVFVDYATEEDAARCVECLHSKEYHNQILKTNFSRNESTFQAIAEPRSVCKAVWIGNVDSSTPALQQQLRELVSHYGRSECVSFLEERHCAFADFATGEEAAACVAGLQGREFAGQKLKANFGKENADYVQQMPPRPVAKSVWIGNLTDLSPSAQQELRVLLAQYGRVESLFYHQNKQCAFANFFTEREAAACVAGLQGREFKGQILKTNFGKVCLLPWVTQRCPMEPVG
eukprot:TRINITY_DN1246_c2_g1_i2.p1 TRINITY_DN1246_c2_g1~~TRINITY_DN1246_c2_g1_i2.p1  ORF type:complete len:1319 (+),score=403.45 TRINITY_DN1246_c2_g1_i2:106-3957(+)